ncbi:hypothetical protein ACE4RU_10720 [Actinobacillus seminis]|uniref:hypothetical protein n=1 Tax=Actinobacillus seminis TaxID=722 RepID=UPI003B93667F
MKFLKLKEMQSMLSTGLLCDPAYRKAALDVFSHLSLNIFWEMGLCVGSFRDVLGQFWRVELTAIKCIDEASQEKRILIRVFPANSNCVAGSCYLFKVNNK